MSEGAAACGPSGAPGRQRAPRAIHGLGTMELPDTNGGEVEGIPPSTSPQVMILAAPLGG